MNDAVKTILFCVVAAATAAGAVVLTREAPEETAKSQVGKNFTDIQNPLLATSLKIVDYDKSTAKPVEFEVAKTKAGYSIPSHENYPADAKQHLADAASSISHLEILAVAGESRDSHEDFGVLDPTDSALSLGSTGVGQRITLGQAEGAPLADFIIGKKAEGPPGRCYVRHADKDQVYTVKIDTKYLTTKFDDWIEKDLLQLDPIELKQVVLKDYSVIKEQEGFYLNDRSTLDISYSEKDLKWVLDKLLVTNDGKATPVKLAKDEELNDQRLEDMKNALDDLKIADVRRKPVGLQGDIRQYMQKHPEALALLLRCGFYPLEYQDPDTNQSSFQIFSDQGEVHAKMTNGVEYILRFGNVAGGEKTADEKGKDDKGKKGDKPGDADKTESTKLLRYLFVQAKFDKDLIPKPELEELPSLKPEPKAPEKAPGKPEDKAKEDKSKDEKPADAKADAPKTAPAKPEASKPEGAKPDAAKPTEKKTIPVKPTAYKPATKAGDGKHAAAKADGKKSAIDAPVDVPEADGADAPKDADKKSADAPKDAKPDAAKEAGHKPQPGKEPAADAANPGEIPHDPVHDAAIRKLEIERITKQNQRRKESYDASVAEGEKTVKNLNDRFAAWYFIISEDTYKKIHLGQKDVIHKKPKEDKGQGQGPPGIPGIPGLPGGIPGLPGGGQ